MSRLGPWNPSTVEERLDRMESLAAIRQLPHRYGLALDSRNLEALVELFLPDVRVGRDATGRAALAEWFTGVMQEIGPSVHFIGNHIVDFDDADHARGIVYCRDELERPKTKKWDIGMLQYWDSYVRVDGEWCFERRKFYRLYIVDALTRPAQGAGVNDADEPLTTSLLPDAFPSWGAFWEKVERTRE